MQADKISAENLVARFLRSHGYHDALESFLQEAGLPENAGEELDSCWTVEGIIEEKRLYDLTLSFEKSDLKDDVSQWQMPIPSKETQLQLTQPANVLQVKIVSLRLSVDGPLEQVLLASTADRRLYAFQWDSTSPNQLAPFDINADSPILSFVTLFDRYIALTTISGGLLIYDPCDNKVLVKRKDHQKYVIQIITTQKNGRTYVATAAWDSRVLLYLVNHDNGDISLSGPIATIQLQSVPESILFNTDPDNDELYLIIARRDSTHLYFYQISGPDATSSGELLLAGKQNLTPFANAWNSFSPASIAACPTDSTLLAIATNSVPHMKVLLVRILFPSQAKNVTNVPAQGVTDSEAPTTAEPAAFRSPTRGQAAGAGDVDPREVAAVLAHTNTNISQTNYSTPVVSWRPDGSGFWVNSEEGTIKGIDRTGKTQATLLGHAAGSKVRCLWAGHVAGDNSGNDEGNKEVLISGGFDQRLVVWKLPE